MDNFQLGGVTGMIKVGDKVEDRLRARRMEEEESWRWFRRGAGRVWVKIVARECGRRQMCNDEGSAAGLWDRDRDRGGFATPRPGRLGDGHSTSREKTG